MTSCGPEPIIFAASRRRSFVSSSFTLARSFSPNCPPTAQSAIGAATWLANNPLAGLRGEPNQAFAFKARGKVASLGHRSAVADIFGLKLSGFIAWLLWRALYLMKMPDLDRKIRVSTDWLLDLLLPRDIVQLKIERSASVGREHFEPREIIFRQGDRGDRLYIVVDGEVEIVKQEHGDGEQVLGRVGPGGCFGEMALVNDHPRMATARTVTRVNLLSVGRDAFDALFAYHPPLRHIFQQLIEERGRGRTGEGQPAPIEDETQPLTRSHAPTS